MKKTLKIAIIHDILIEYGGGEKVLEEMSKIFPQADLYTSVINFDQVGEKTSLDLSKIRVSWLQKFSFVRSHPRLVQLLAPFIWVSFDFSAYDLVISHGGYYFSNMVTLGRRKNRTRYVHYLISPAKNIYKIDKQTVFDKSLGLFIYPFLKQLDKLALIRADLVIAVSKVVQTRCQKAHSIQSLVINPPVDVNSNLDKTKRHLPKFYCYFGRLVEEKNIDLIISCFNKNQKPILIVGDGKLKEKLMLRAKNNVIFLGFRNKQEMALITKFCRAFIHAADQEDFGIAPIEAMSYGLPVIAYDGGALGETLVDGSTGILFKELSVRALNNAITKFESGSFDREACINQAQQFSSAHFKQAFLKAVLG